MVLFPIGRDQGVIRRHAWVTYAILALYFAVFATLAVKHAGAERRFVENAHAIDLLIRKDPYVVLPKQLEVIIGREKFQKLQSEMPERPLRGVDPKRLDEAQKRLDDIAVQIVDDYRNIGQLQDAYVPAQSSMFKVFLSMWVQFSFLALIVDCLVLFSTGPYIEDVFGRPAYVLLYVAGAFSSAVVFGSYVNDPNLGLFGAAGAISAVVGAFLVRFYNSKLDMMFLVYRFTAPAWLVIVAWAGVQIFYASQSSANAIANLGGFAFGVFFAAGLKLAKYEETVVAPHVSNQTTWAMNEHLMRALESDDAATRRSELTAFFAAKTARAEEVETAMELVRESLRDSDAQFCSQAASFAERNRAFDLALAAYDRACALDPAGANAVRNLMRIGSLKKQAGDVIGARTALMRAKTHAACPADVKATIEARLSQLQA